MRRLPSGLTTPGAIAAPASGALAAHQPMPPKNSPITRAPARIGRRSSCMSDADAVGAASCGGRVAQRRSISAIMTRPPSRRAPHA